MNKFCNNCFIIVKITGLLWLGGNLAPRALLLCSCAAAAAALERIPKED